MSLRKCYWVVGILAFGSFCLFNLAGAGLGGMTYQGSIEELNRFNEIDTTGFEFFQKFSLDIVSDENNTLARVHFMVSFSLPSVEENLKIVLTINTQPVIYDFLVFNDFLYDYIELDITQISIGAGNETLEFVSMTGILKEIIFSEGLTYVETEINLPQNWFNSENKTVYFEIGNFQVEKRERKFDAKNIIGQTNLLLKFTRQHFRDGFADEDYGIFDYLETDFSVYFSSNTAIRVVLAGLIFLIVILADLIFISDIVNCCMRRMKTIHDIPQNNENLNENNVDEKNKIKPIVIETENKRRFEKFARQRGFFFSVSTLLFIYSVLLYLFGYVIFGGSAVKDYPFFCILFALVSYLVYLGTIGRMKLFRHRVKEENEDKPELHKYLDNTENQYKSVTKEIISTISTLIALYLFIFGGSAFQYLWF